MSILLLLFALLTNVLFLTFLVLKRSLYSPTSVFCIIWIIIYSLYFLNLDSWITIDFPSAMCLFVGNFFVVLPSTFPWKKDVRFSHEAYFVNYKAINILLLISIVFTLFSQWRNILLLLNGGDFNGIYIGNAIEGNLNNGSFVEKALGVLLLKPLLFVNIPLFLHNLFSEKKNIAHLLFSILYLALSFLSNGKRALLIFFGACLLLTFLISRKEKKSTRSAFLVSCLLIVSAVAIVFASYNRGSSIKDSLSVYFSGGIPSFNIRTQVIDTHYYGLAMLHGIESPIMIGLKGIFGFEYPNWWVTLDGLIEAADYVQIGQSSFINAFNTLYYIPYLDFGIVGIVIESFAFGCFLNFTWQRFICQKNLRTYSLYIFAIIAAVGSMYTFYFTQYPFMIGFLYTFLFIRRQKKSCYRVRHFVISQAPFNKSSMN